MPVHSIEVTSEGITICKSSNDCEYFPFAGVILPDSQEKAEAIAKFIQEEYLDDRIPLNKLGLDEDDRSTDPGLPYCFWEGTGNPAKTVLVTRTILCTIEWIDNQYIPMLRRMI